MFTRCHWVSYVLTHVTVKVGRTWITVGNNIDCDWSAGEKYLQSSQPNVVSVEQCQKSCEDAEGCESITYFENSGWCSHFGTPCTKTINYSRKRSVVFRLNEGHLGTEMTSKTGGQYLNGSFDILQLNARGVYTYYLSLRIFLSIIYTCSCICVAI